MKFPKKVRKRNDKEQGLAKVMKAVLEDPLMTQTQLAKKTGISPAGINHKIKELEDLGMKIPTIKDICEQDINIVKMANVVRNSFVMQMVKKVEIGELIERKDWEKIYEMGFINGMELESLKEGDGNNAYDYVITSLRDRAEISKNEAITIDKISETSHKRYMLFAGKATDESWGLKPLEELSIESLWQRLNDLNLKKQGDGIEWGGEDWERDNKESISGEELGG